MFTNRYTAVVQPFFPYVASLNAALREHEAVISGSVALKFFLPDEAWTPSDIDIYVSDGRFESLRDRLRSDPLLGCTEAQEDPGAPKPSYHSDFAVKDVAKFTTMTGRKVDLVRSRDKSAMSPMLDFWSTLPANFITPDAFACLYHKYTLNRQIVLKVGILGSEDTSAVRKYVDRGFKVVSNRYWVAWGFYPNGGGQIASVRALVSSMDPLNPERKSTSLPIRRGSYGWFLRGAVNEDTDDDYLGFPAASIVPVIFPGDEPMDALTVMV